MAWRGWLGRGSVAVMALVASLSACPTTDTASCELDTDCASDEECQSGRCVVRNVAACSEDLDCGNGRVCVGGVCQVRNTRSDAGIIRFDGGGGGSSSSGTPGLGVLHLDPSDTVDFGSPLINQGITKYVLARNDGTGTLVISGVRLTADSSTQFALSTSPLPISLGVNEETRFTLVYTNTDSTADLGVLLVQSDAMGCTFNCPDPQNARVPLFSEFKGGKDLTLNPTLHDFGFVAVNASSASFNIQAGNNGTFSRFLTVTALNMTGADALQFDLDEAAITLPAYLYPGDLLNIPVTYKPLVMGSHSVTITVTADSDNPSLRTLSATLTGRSVPTVDISADPINFGSVQVGQERTMPTTIHNNSNVSVSITNGAFANGAGVMGFHLPTQWPFPINIAAGATAQLNVTFRPVGTVQTPQNRADTLQLSHTLASTFVNASLSGVADPPPPPPGGPKLEMAMSYTRESSRDSGCNTAALYNSQNMDLILEGGGGTCEKPTQVGGACPTDASCTCNFGGQGSGRWQASGGTAPEPYLLEAITHNGDGGDGTFVVKNRYWDDCADNWQSGSAAIMQAVCGYGGTPPMRYYCYPRAKYPTLYVACGQPGEPYNGYCISETQCLYAASAYDGRCGARKPSKAKTVVTIRSASNLVVQQKAYCVDFAQANQGLKEDVVTIIREQGYFRLGTTGALATELPNVSASCP